MRSKLGGLVLLVAALAQGACGGDGDSSPEEASGSRLDEAVQAAGVAIEGVTDAEVADLIRKTCAGQGGAEAVRDASEAVGRESVQDVMELGEGVLDGAQVYCPEELEAAIDATTTTTRRPTTTTTEPEPEIALEFASKDGWQYRLVVDSVTPTPEASRGACIDTAPPGKTNLVVSFAVENLLTDRSSPTPELHFGLNLNGDGTAVDPAAVDITSVPVEDQEVDAEVTPNEPGMCLLADSVSDDFTIPRSGSLDFKVAFGPISDPPPSGLVLLIRKFDGPGDYEDFTLPLGV